MDTVALLLSIVLPLALGAIIVRWRADGGARASWAITLGYGYLIGSFLLTLLMRLLSLAGISWSFWLIGLLLIMLCAALIATDRTLLTRDAWRVPPPTVHAGQQWQRWLFWLLMAWLTVRGITLLTEVMWRPLYAWDAWTQWATKARVWFEYKSMLPFVRGETWFAMPNAQQFIDAAPHYPATAPLLQVWSCLALGRWDDAAMNLPWVAAYAALLFAVYGQLRVFGVMSLPAMVVTWVLGTLPFLNTHVALAGYAELHIATYYAAAGMAFMQWIRGVGGPPPNLRWSTVRSWFMRGSKRQILLFVLCVAALPTIKLPGWVWAVSFIPAIAVLLAPRAAFALIVAAIVLMLIGTPLLAELGLGFGLYRFDVTNDLAGVTTGLKRNLFMLGNWHLLWVMVIAAFLWQGKQLWQPALRPALAMTLYAVAFLAFVFFYTIAADWVTDFTTVNRALIHVVPLLGFIAAVALRDHLNEEHVEG